MTFLDSFSPDVQSQATDIVKEIARNNGKSVRLRVEQGQRLLRLKALIGHGGWLAWLVSPEANSGYSSIRTPERDMKLAEALGARIAELTDEMLATMTNLTAMRALADDEKADALEAAFALMRRGIKVGGIEADKLVTIYAASRDLGDRVREGKITIDDAHRVAACIDDINPPTTVVDLVVNSGVKSAGVVEALTVLADEQPEKFEEIAVSGTIYNAATGQDVPLGEASSADAMLAVFDELSERESRRRQHIQDWRDGQRPAIARVSGTISQITAELARLVPSDQPVLVYVYPDKVVESA